MRWQRKVMWMCLIIGPIMMGIAIGLRSWGIGVNAGMWFVLAMAWSNLARAQDYLDEMKRNHQSAKETMEAVERLRKREK